MEGGTSAEPVTKHDNRHVRVLAAALVLLVGFAPAVQAAGTAMRGSCVTVYTHGPGVDVDPNCDPIGTDALWFPPLYPSPYLDLALDIHLPHDGPDTPLTVNESLIGPADAEDPLGTGTLLTLWLETPSHSPPADQEAR